MSPRPPTPGAVRERAPRRGGLVKAVVIAVFAAAVLMIVRDEVPVVAEFIEGVFDPGAATARAGCREAALAAAEQPDYARVVERGVVNTTQNGYYIEGVVIGNMAEDGAERRFRVDCYADANGQLVNTHRRTP